MFVCQSLVQLIDIPDILLICFASNIQKLVAVGLKRWLGLTGKYMDRVFWISLGQHTHEHWQRQSHPGGGDQEQACLRRGRARLGCDSFFIQICANKLLNLGKLLIGYHLQDISSFLIIVDKGLPRVQLAKAETDSQTTLSSNWANSWLNCVGWASGILSQMHLLPSWSDEFRRRQAVNPGISASLLGPVYSRPTEMISLSKSILFSSFRAPRTSVNLSSCWTNSAVDWSYWGARGTETCLQRHRVGLQLLYDLYSNQSR